MEKYKVYMDEKQCAMCCYTLNSVQGTYHSGKSFIHNW